MTNDATADRLDKILKGIEGKLDDAQWLDPEEIAAFREMVEYREDIVREYRKRRARKVVLDEIKAFFRNWYGVFLFFAGAWAFWSQWTGGIAEVLAWLSSFKP